MRFCRETKFFYAWREPVTATAVFTGSTAQPAMPKAELFPAFVNVAVPKDMKPGNSAVNDGQQYNSTLP